MLIAAVFQAERLIGDLCLDYGLPHPLFQRLARRKLLFDDSGTQAKGIGLQLDESKDKREQGNESVEFFCYLWTERCR